MNPVFYSYTARSKAFDYDAMQNYTGKLPVNGFSYQGFRAPEYLIAQDHDDNPDGLFEKPPVVSYFPGPASETAGTGLPFAHQWAAWVSERGVRVALAARISPPAPSEGTKSHLYPSARPKALGGAFSAQGYMAIAAELENETVKIRRFVDAETITTTEFAGRSPVLYLNRLNSTDAPDDIQIGCYYLKTGAPKSLFFRMESEDFTVEHVAASNLPLELAALVQMDDFGDRFELLARDVLGRDVQLVSHSYAATPATEKMSLSVGLLDGSLFAGALKDAGSEKTLISVLLLNGSVFLSTTTPPSITADHSTLSIAILNGEYEAV